MNYQYDSLINATRIAIEYHEGQLRRDGKTPYILHPDKVASLLEGDTEAEITAMLHDLFEDTECPPELLENNFSESIVYAVNLLTHEPEVTYEEYIGQIKTHELAKKVKVADIVANLTDSPTEKQIQKYTKALLQLVAGS